jgi:crotonobetaine/carnitine-CoA ligase
VQAVAVVGKSHDFLSEVVVAFVIPAPGDHDLDAVAAEIVERAEQNLASFMVPRAVYFVDEFPTGTLEKILKNKLRDMADARPPVE